MTDSRTVLQLCPFSDYLTQALNERFTIVRWFELDAEAQAAWLADNAASVGGIATGGHIGCPTALMEALPKLGVIAINGIGFDKVDLAVAKARGIRVSTTPDVLTNDVADLAVGLTIGLLRALPAAHAHAASGAWEQGEVPLGRSVSGRRFGIVGLGRIGAAIAARLAPFGPVSYFDTEQKPGAYRFVDDVTTLARESDVLVLACPANAHTRHLANAALFEALGPSGYLVNVARGSVVDEGALIDALDAGTIAGAALDVFEDEPRIPQALRHSGRVMLTPHIASATVETRTAMADLVLANLSAFFAGAPLPTAIV